MDVAKLIEEFNKLELDAEHQKVLDEYDALTDENQHGEALMLLCKYFKREDLVKKLEHINALHDLYGHLPKALGELRYEIENEIKPKFLVEFKGYTQEDADKYVEELRKLTLI